jgi:hypothetical protein
MAKTSAKKKIMPPAFKKNINPPFGKPKADAGTNMSEEPHAGFIGLSDQTSGPRGIPAA